jgi:PTS system nitrogen regulatory IIA component
MKITTEPKKPMIQLADYVDERMILFLDAATKEEVLAQLVDLAISTKELPAKERFYQAVLDREHLVSTAIGMGVAVPHAKLPVYSDFFVAVAILHKGVEWNAIDDALVRVVFLIGGPDNRQTDYLKILSSVTGIIRDEKLRRRLMKSTTPAAVAAILRGGS